MAWVVEEEPARAGYYFDGWRHPDGDILQAGDDFVMPADDMTLTAIWKELIPIEVTAGSALKQYDGEPLYWPCSDVSGLPEGYKIDVQIVGMRTTPGSAMNYVGEVVIWQNGVDVTKRFSIIRNTGLLIVMSIPISFGTGSAEKVYDGTPLMKKEIFVTDGELLVGHRLDFEGVIFPSITNAGARGNIPETYEIHKIRVVDGEGNDCTAYYYRTWDRFSYGTLTVTAPAVVPPVDPPVDSPVTPPVDPPVTPPVTPVVLVTPVVVPVAPVVPVVNPDEEPPTAAQDDVTEDAVTPVVIEDPPAPQAGSAAWALLNLILTIVTGVVAILLLAHYFRRRRDEDRDEGKNEGKAAVAGLKADDEDDDERMKRPLAVRFVSIAMTAGAIILFLRTEDMSLPMIVIDRWTVWHVALFAVALVSAFFCRYRKEDEEGSEEAAKA
jgi:uncharacterized repeat protein (TIGR02543 family)